MKDEKNELRVKIAKFCGWTSVSLGSGITVGWVKEGEKDRINDCYLPDYCNDLNAMHEAEKALIEKNLFQDYWPILEHVVGKEMGRAASGLTIRATASERAEAFIKTIGM